MKKMAELKGEGTLIEKGPQLNRKRKKIAPTKSFPLKKRFFSN